MKNRFVSDHGVRTRCDLILGDKKLLYSPKVNPCGDSKIKNEKRKMKNWTNIL
jgi:hypothetical protein